MVTQSATLNGKITAEASLTMKINAEASMTGTICRPVGYADYNGDCHVTPKCSEQILPTRDKHMTDDVTIRAIPMYTVSNETGGDTVYIGSEV